MKFDMGSIVEKIKKDRPESANLIGLGSDLSKLKPEDYLTMPEWWQQAAEVPGLPYGRIVQIAGDSDSGKTSAAIEAMKAANEQGVGIIYAETENKTTEQDLSERGVDASQVILVKSSVAEELFTELFIAWDDFKAKYPNAPLLVIIDSLGNVVSQRDSEIDFTESSQKPGGKGQINRAGIGKMILRREDKAAILLINYTYDNIGSHGKTNAGGKSLSFYSSLIFQTTRKSWVEKTVKGEKRKAGIIAKWVLTKNHLNRNSSNAKEFCLQIDDKGIRVVE